MKNHKIQKLLARPLALLCCAALLASCYSEDEMDGCFPAAPEGGKATVRIGVTAERPDEPLKRAVEEGKAHEYMNHLHVLIVRADGTLAMDLLPDLSADALAQAGDLERWTSGPIELEPGTYTLYAVANWKGYNNATLNVLSTNIPESGNVEGSTSFPTWLQSLRTLQLEDPAGRVKIDDASVQAGEAVFIPMSGMTVANVTASTTMLEIPLDRLVSKVRVALDLTQAEHGLSDGARLTFSNICPVVGLFEPIGSMDDITLPGDSWTTLSYSQALSAQAVGTSGTIPDFYVNETLGSEGFLVELETGNTSGVMAYTATTRLTDLGRNSIYPLTLDFSAWKLGLEVQAWKSPIDEYPLPLSVSQESADTYRATGLCEGGQFRLTIPNVTKTEDGSKTTVKQVDWTILNEPWGIRFENNGYTHTSYATSAAGGGTTPPFVDGSISGDDRLVGTDFTVEARVYWEDGADSYERTYRIVFADLLDITEARTRSAIRRSLLEPCWLQPETLTLFMKK